jgi:hypothetical protein
MQQNMLTLLTRSSCTHDFDLVLNINNTQYCDSTPTAANEGTIQATNAVATQAPLNFVDIALVSNPHGAREQFMAAAFDDDSESVAEGSFELGRRCSTSLSHGTATLPIVSRFYGIAPLNAVVTWCEFNDNAGHWRWLAAFNTPLGSGAKAAHLRVFYSIDADLGVIDGTQLLDRLSRQAKDLLQPIAPFPS